MSPMTYPSPHTVTQAIFKALPHDMAQQTRVRSITLGGHLAAVRLQNSDAQNSLGLASRVDAGHGRSIARELDTAALARDWGLHSQELDNQELDNQELDSGLQALDLARLLDLTPARTPDRTSDRTLATAPNAQPSSPADSSDADPLLKRSIALATVNALLPPPPSDAHVSEKKGQDLLLERGKDKRVVVVGHFPFVERLADQFASFDVLEKRPRPGDLPAEAAAQVFPKADVAAITSTSISNGTLAELLSLCREDCFVLLLGPSTPLAPSLFDLGVDALAGARLREADALESVLNGVRAGHPYKSLPGMQPVLWLK